MSREEFNIDRCSNDQIEHLCASIDAGIPLPPLHNYRPLVRTIPDEPVLTKREHRELEQVIGMETPEIETAWEEVRRARVMVWATFGVLMVVAGAVAGIIIGLLHGHGGRQ